MLLAAVLSYAAQSQRVPTVSAPFGGVVQSSGDPVNVTFVVVSDYETYDQEMFSDLMEIVCEDAGYKPVCDHGGCDAANILEWFGNYFTIPWDVHAQYDDHPEPAGWCAIADDFLNDFCLYPGTNGRNAACVVEGEYDYYNNFEKHHKNVDSGFPILCSKVENTTATPPDCTSVPTPTPEPTATVSAPFGGVVKSANRNATNVTFVVVSNWTNQDNLTSFDTVMERVCSEAGYSPVCTVEGCAEGSPSGWNYQTFTIPWDENPYYDEGFNDPDGWCAIEFPPDFCLYGGGQVNYCVVGGTYNDENEYHKNVYSGFPILCGKTEPTTETPLGCTAIPTPGPTQDANVITEHNFDGVLEIDGYLKHVSFKVVSDWTHEGNDIDLAVVDVCGNVDMKPVCDHTGCNHSALNLGHSGLILDDFYRPDSPTTYPVGWCGIRNAFPSNFCTWAPSPQTFIAQHAECVLNGINMHISRDDFFVSKPPILCGRADDTDNDLPACAIGAPGPSPSPTPTPGPTAADTLEPTEYICCRAIIINDSGSGIDSTECSVENANVTRQQCDVLAYTKNEAQPPNSHWPLWGAGSQHCRDRFLPPIAPVTDSITEQAEWTGCAGAVPIDLWPGVPSTPTGNPTPGPTAAETPPQTPTPGPPEPTYDDFDGVLGLSDGTKKRVYFSVVSGWTHADTSAANFQTVANDVCGEHEKNMQPVCDSICTDGLQIVTSGFVTSDFGYEAASTYADGWCGIKDNLSTKSFCITLTGAWPPSPECVVDGSYVATSFLADYSGFPILCGKADELTTDDLPACATATPGPTPEPTPGPTASQTASVFDFEAALRIGGSVKRVEFKVVSDWVHESKTNFTAMMFDVCDDVGMLPVCENIAPATAGVLC